MPLRQGFSKGAISGNIREMMAAGRPQRQAVSIAMDAARKAVAGRGTRVRSRQNPPNRAAIMRRIGPPVRGGR